MKNHAKALVKFVSFACLVLPAGTLAQQAIDKSVIIASLHAEGAQIYECKPDSSKPAALMSRRAVASATSSSVA